jgi:hypothetical protein
MRSALFVPLAVVLAAATAPARAQAPVQEPAPASRSRPPVQLTYNRGPAAGDCADEGGLRQAVIKELAYDPFQPTAPLHLTVSIDRRAGELVVALEERDEAGQVIWDDDTIKTRSPCKSLIKAVGIVIAMRLEAEPPPPAPPPAPPAPPAPVPATPAAAPPIAPPLAIAPPPPKAGYPIAAGVDAIFTPFFTPSFSAGVSPWVAFRPVEVPLSIEVALRATWSVTPARLRLEFYRSTYMSGLLQACWRPWARLFVCPMIEAGVVSLSPTEMESAVGGSGPSLRVAAGLGGAYEQPLAEHLAFRVSTQVEGLPVASPVVTSGGIGWLPSRFAFSWGLGLAVRP